MASITKEEGILVLDNIIKVIQENKQYLSDIDGAIGDGDHGINMNKGFSLCREELDKNPGDLPHGLNLLSRILMMKIGGSMGPLYGKFFKGISSSLARHETIDAQAFGEALKASKDAIGSISQAKIGDKTLVDALYPAVDAYQKALDEGKDFYGGTGRYETGSHCRARQYKRPGCQDWPFEPSRGTLKRRDRCRRRIMCTDPCEHG